MELEATGPSVPSVILDEDGNMIDSRLPSGEPLQFVFEEIKWQQELSWEEAARRLEVAMYPFKKVRLGGVRARVRLHGAGAVGAAGEHRASGSGQGLLLRLLPCRAQRGQGASPLPSGTWRRHPAFQPTHTHTHPKHVCTHELHTPHTETLHVVQSSREWGPGHTL